MSQVFAVSYKYPNIADKYPDTDELKRTFLTVSQVLQFVDEVLRDPQKTVEYIRISPRNV